ncbi:MAG: DUF6161 domain-containing protein [Lachnospiraceae bacterium]|nr:DUF6161 domain-containing protein [Lachnospiraceae bacterium]
MTQPEIEVLISKHLSANPITLTDLFNNNIRLDSYEKYITELTWIIKTFKNIPEFCDDTNVYLDRMKKLIIDCLASNDSSAQSRINNARRELCGNGYTTITLKSISSLSVKNTSECSEQTFLQVYNELGYNNLKHYIDLLRSPSNLTSYLNSNDKQTVAMHYLLYKTDHHSSSRFKRDFSTKSLYATMDANIKDSLSEITSQKEDYVNFMNAEKDHYKKWYQESNDQINQLYTDSKNEYDSFLSDSKASIEQIKTTYANKLKVEKPAEFMEQKAKKYMCSSIRWAVATVILSVALLFLMYLILDPDIEMDEKLITIKLFSNQMPIYSSIIIFSMIALIIYVIKLFIKMALSSKHLSEEYHQKYVLTYFYLALLNDGKIEEKQADVILATLFSKADTGLIKNDSGSEIEGMNKMFSLLKNNL